ncbi:MAG: helix-turn-helix domain-containing protein [Pseudomonadota bacterium]
MIRLKDVVLIHDLKRQGLSVSAIARYLGCDRKTVRKYLEAGLEPPLYSPRPPRGSKLDGFRDCLEDRVAAYPDLSAKRLFREIAADGHEGGYTTVKKFLRGVRPPARTQVERRFETPAGKQAQVDFEEVSVEFTDEPGVTRKVYLFSMVLGHSRWLWGRFASSQNLQTVMRCHIAAFEGLPLERQWSERHWRTVARPRKSSTTG